MPNYQLFGGILRSELDFVELSPCAGRHPRWYLTRAMSAPSTSEMEALGSEDVDKGVRVTLYRAPNFYRLAFDDTGMFDVSVDGRHICWIPSADPNLDLVRKDVLGRVFAVCLQLDGISALHGSAVKVGDEAIAFLAPKFHGKSTTAAALVDRGGRLLADDIVAVTPGAAPHVMPSVPVVQLWQDSAERVARISASARGNGSSPKLQRGWDDAERVALSPVPFAAVYLLAPFTPDATRPVRRERLSHVSATLALVGQAKIGMLLGPAWRATLLSQFAELATAVPVYRLELPRDYSRLGELTETLWSWHAPLLAGAQAIA
jgi:hypothetical protein